ncbi:MAG TPA: M15 family metallopeptidase [Chitinophagaceae bacterium]|nr:M15 family metallopeptidase [Chitinophagaceae bacterium]
MQQKWPIQLRKQILFLLFLMLLLPGKNANCQETILAKEVTHKVQDYLQQVQLEPQKNMFELHQLMPGLVYDLRYATLNNFMQRRMYPKKTAITFLRKPAALALQQVQKSLLKKGLGLKIFDAYRPYAVTVKFWELVHDERYVANPKNGSGHNRGVAVDLTIIDKKTNKELNMGTGFDNFTDSAHQAYNLLPEAILQNRKLLKTTMEQYGFKAYENEWWHYSWSDSIHYEILDLPFKKLKKITGE